MQTRALPTQPMDAGAFGPSDETALWWLTNAGFLVNSHGVTIMVDPAISISETAPDRHEGGSRLLVPLPIEAREAPQLDAVLYTHSDGDHFADLTARLLARTKALFVGPPPVLAKVADLGLPPERMRPARAGEPFHVGPVEVIPTPADHPWQLRYATAGPPFGPEDCVGYLLRTPDGTVWHTGDTRLMPEHLCVSGVDVLLLDVSPCEYHLGTAAAARLANALGSPYVIPYHYGTYDEPSHDAYNGDPAEVAAMMHDPANRLHILAPGEKWVLRTPASPEDGAIPRSGISPAPLRPATRRRQLQCPCR